MKDNIFRYTREKGIPKLKKAEGDAGYDLVAKHTTTILPNEFQLVGTGISVEIPSGYVGLLLPRSSLATRYGLQLNTGVIDSSYRGELILSLYNPSPGFLVKVKGLTKVAQLVIVSLLNAVPVEAKTLSKTDRGANGFGSTDAVYYQEEIVGVAV